MKYELRTGTETQVKQVLTLRDLMTSICVAGSLWTMIVVMARMTSNTWNFPLAAIVGLAVLPLGLLGGIRRRS